MTKITSKRTLLVMLLAIAMVFAMSFGVSAAKAEIDGKPYDTIAKALTQVQNDQTITLLEDVNSNGVNLSADGITFTFDLNGHNINNDAGPGINVEQGNVTIIDSKYFFGGGKVHGSTCAVRVGNDSVTIKGGFFSSEGKTIINLNETAESLSIEGGIFGNDKVLDTIGYKDETADLEKFLAEGYKVFPLANNGPYAVLKEEPVSQPLAIFKVNGIVYDIFVRDDNHTTYDAPAFNWKGYEPIEEWVDASDGTNKIAVDAEDIEFGNKTVIWNAETQALPQKVAFAEDISEFIDTAEDSDNAGDKTVATGGIVNFVCDKEVPDGLLNAFNVKAADGYVVTKIGIRPLNISAGLPNPFGDYAYINVPQSGIVSVPMFAGGLEYCAVAVKNEFNLKVDYVDWKDSVKEVLVEDIYVDSVFIGDAEEDNAAIAENLKAGTPVSFKIEAQNGYSYEYQIQYACL